MDGQITARRLRPSKSNGDLRTVVPQPLVPPQRSSSVKLRISLPDYSPVNRDTQDVSSRLPEADEPRAYSRLHIVRHVKGFRSYNELYNLATAVVATCNNIKEILERRQTTLDWVIWRTTKSVEALQKAEFIFFKECDKILVHSRKAKELEFLKYNLQNCIRNSIGVVKQQLPDDDNSEIKNLLRNPWPDHNQYRATVTHLRQYLVNASQQLFTCDSVGSVVTSIDAGSINKTVEETLHFLNSCFQNQSAIRRIVDAGITLSTLQCDYITRLKPIEEGLNRSIQEKHVIVEALISLSAEVQHTENMLITRAKHISKDTQRSLQRDVFEEERVLLEFIYNGKEFEREEQRRLGQARELASPQSSLSEANSELSTPSTPSTPPTPSTPSLSSKPAPPVKWKRAGQFKSAKGDYFVDVKPAVWALSWSTYTPKFIKPKLPSKKQA